MAVSGWILSWLNDWRNSSRQSVKREPVWLWFLSARRVVSSSKAMASQDGDRGQNEDSCFNGRGVLVVVISFIDLILRQDYGLSRA